MSAFKQAGRWYWRKRVRVGATKVRVYVSPRDYNLPNTKASAEEAGRRRVAELMGERAPHQPTATPPRPLSPRTVRGDITFADFTATLLEHAEVETEFSSVKSKRQIIRDHIGPRFDAMPLRLITFEAIEDFKHHLVRSKASGGAGVKRKTGNNILSVLHRALDLARKRGKISALPEFAWFPKDPLAPFRHLSPAESADLIECASPRFRSMVLVALRCGLRQSELLGLQWSNVDTKAGRLTVRHTIVCGRLKEYPKGRKVREIPLSDDVCRALIVERHLRGPFVFCHEDGTRLTQGECKHPLYRAAEGAGIATSNKRLGWHVLRHTFASQLAMAGVDVVTIQKLMGHSTLRMTERYMHLSPDVARDAVRKLDLGQILASPPRKRGNKRVA